MVNAILFWFANLAAKRGIKPNMSATAKRQAKLIEEAMHEKAQQTAEAAALLTIRDQFIAAQEDTESPWAMFEIADFPEDGQIKVDFNWNEAFIRRINALGFQAENEQDSVQLFFYTSSMKPTEFDDEPITEGTPQLSSPLNRIMP